jgi:hypothetical protein
MPRHKSETLSIRTTAEIKEHRSVASMLEVLVMAHADHLGIKAASKAGKINQDQQEVAHGH